MKGNKEPKGSYMKYCQDYKQKPETPEAKEGFKIMKKLKSLIKSQNEKR
jgi:hypothetical protein